MATRILRFDMIECGVSFRMTDWTERGVPVETVFVKTSARKACRPEDVCGTLRPVGEFAVKPTARVTVDVPERDEVRRIVDEEMLQLSTRMTAGQWDDLHMMVHAALLSVALQAKGAL